jgi:S-adenosylmethionine:tRNA ribosyltransferase-isomerase
MALEVPAELAAAEPPEARGLSRDGVRLMVSRVSDAARRGDEVTHTRFDELPDVLDPGDLLVVNTSATINASFDAVRVSRDGTSDVEVHLSTRLSGQQWVIELRRVSAKGSVPLLDARAGEGVRMPGGATASLVEPYESSGAHSNGNVRLWIAEMTMPMEAMAYAARFGSPIRYGYVPRRWPLSYYQTVFAGEPGSVEMPSAGRPFTMGMLERLASRGIGIATIVLHTGVSSLEAHEAPYRERCRVPATTARAVNVTRALGRRVVAVGTTVVRALETFASPDGAVRAGEGWTSLVMGPKRGPLVVDALLTGLHPPNSSHLSMLETFAPRDHLTRAYDAALHERYLWHEFGDLHLILP